MSKRRVLLVDDNAPIRAGVRRLFSVHHNFEVCGEAAHGREAVETAQGLRPDLIVLDLTMHVMNGLEAAPLLIKLLPEVWLMLLTSHDSPELQQLARAAGIHAVVSKSEADMHLIAQAEALVSREGSAA